MTECGGRGETPKNMRCEMTMMMNVVINRREADHGFARNLAIKFIVINLASDVVTEKCVM